MNILCRRTTDWLTFLKYFIGLLNFIFLVFYGTHEKKIKLIKKNIFTCETVKHIASFTFYLNYTNFPDVQKHGELSALKPSVGFLSYEL